EDDFDAAVLLTPLGCNVIAHGILRTQPLRRYRTGIQSLADEVVADGTGAVLGKSLVEFGASGVVGVALDLQAKGGVVKHDAGELRQDLTPLWAKIGLAGIKHNVAHIDHQPAWRVGSWQDTIKVCEQTGAECLLLALVLIHGLFPRLGCGLFDLCARLSFRSFLYRRLGSLPRRQLFLDNLFPRLGPGVFHIRFLLGQGSCLGCRPLALGLFRQRLFPSLGIFLGLFLDRICLSLGGPLLIRFPLVRSSLLGRYAIPQAIHDTDGETKMALSCIYEMGAEKVDLHSSRPMGREAIIAASTDHP